MRLVVSVPLLPLVLLAAVLATVAPPPAAGASSDVSFTVRVSGPDGERLVDRVVRGPFGRTLVVEQRDLVRVEMRADRPDADGRSTVSVVAFRRDSGEWKSFASKPLVMTVPLPAVASRWCDGFTFTFAFPDRETNLCVLPRTANAVLAPPVDPAQWPAITRADLDRLRYLIEEAHPGARLRDDPAFSAWLADGHRQATELAKDVRTRVQSEALLAYYLAGFDDPHLSLPLRNDELRWAGFSVTPRDGRWVVQATDTHWPAPLPPAGATLQGCDGRPVAELLAEIAPYFDHRFGIPSVYAEQGLHLTIDGLRIPNRSPYRRCAFVTADGRKMELALRWQSYMPELMPRGLRALVGASPSSRRFAISDEGGGRYWVRMPTFAVDGKGLAEIDAMVAKLETLGDATLVVFDLRGNEGGNSLIGSMLLEALTGRLDITDAQAAAAPDRKALWRVSKLNAGMLQTRAAANAAALGEEHPSTRFMREYAARMQAALAAGEPWVEQPGGKAITQALLTKWGTTARRYKGPIVVVTDETCFSACLDFMDEVLLYPGVRHVGQTTGADSRYTDVDAYAIRDGLEVSIPRKVWLGRPRGSNVPYVPSQVYWGDIGHDAAVKAWVLGQTSLRAGL